jgi:hypothetical protein
VLFWPASHVPQGKVSPVCSSVKAYDFDQIDRVHR